MCNVVVMPMFKVAPPDDVLVDQGQTLVLDCSAAGEPKPVVMWHRESVNNPVSSEDRASVLTNDSLRCYSHFLLTVEIITTRDVGAS